MASSALSCLHVSTLLRRIAQLRFSLWSPPVARGFFDDRPQCPAIVFGQITGLRQVGQKWRERAIAERLGQRTKPPADELVTI